jgi:hypothetical protein
MEHTAKARPESSAVSACKTWLISSTFDETAARQTRRSRHHHRVSPSTRYAVLARFNSVRMVTATHFAIFSISFYAFYKSFIRSLSALLHQGNLDAQSHHMDGLENMQRLYSRAHDDDSFQFKQLLNVQAWILFNRKLDPVEWRGWSLHHLAGYLVGLSWLSYL